MIALIVHDTFEYVGPTGGLLRPSPEWVGFVQTALAVTHKVFSKCPSNRKLRQDIETEVILELMKNSPTSSIGQGTCQKHIAFAIRELITMKLK